MGDHVFLKVMPKRGVVRFNKRGKLEPRYIRPFEILERVGTVAYRLALPRVYQVSMRCSTSSCSRSILHIQLMQWRGGIIVDTDGTFEEGPTRIFDSRDQVLRRKTMTLVKVLWQHQGVEKATWE